MPSHRPVPSPGLAHVRALLVGFDYDGPVDPVRPDIELPKLRGAVQDVIAEWRLLRELGLPPGNTRVFTDLAPPEMKARLSAEGLLDDGLDVRRITCEQAFYDAVVEASDAPAPSDEPRRLILMWSGHGDARPDVPERPPALFLPDGSHITVRGLMALLWEKWGWGRRKAGDPPNLVAVLSACHTAATLSNPEDARSGGAGLPLTFGDLGAAVLAASTPSAVAHEVYVDARWRSALSWAATTVLSRYQRRRDGSLALTYADLMYRVRSLLSAIDVPDQPRLFTPTDEHNRYLLRGYGDLELGESRARDGTPIEIWPTNGIKPNEAHLYAAKDPTGHVLGYVVLVGASTAAWDQNWISQGFKQKSLSFPGGVLSGASSFQVDATATVIDLTKPPSTHGPNPNLSTATTFHTLGTWSQKGTYSVPAPRFVITGGAHTAYAVYSSSAGALTVYGNTNTNVIGTPATASFTYQSSGSVQVSYRVTDS